MCIFVMKIPAVTKPYNVILLMNCVFLIPIGVAFFKALFYSEKTFGLAFLLELAETGLTGYLWNQTKKPSIDLEEIWYPKIFGLAFLLELAGTGLTGYLWSQTKKPSIDSKEIWYPIVGVLCLSIAWLPEIQSYLLKTNETKANKNTIPKRDFTITVDQTEAITEEPQVIVQDKPTWKMVIFLSLCRIIFTFVFSFVLLSFSIFSAEASDVAANFRMAWSNLGGDVTYYFIANCSSSLLGYIVGFIACTTCMQKGSYVFPLFLATPLAAVLLAMKASCHKIVFAGVEAGDSEISNQCGLTETLDIILFCVAVTCLVLAHFLSFGILIINSPLLVKQSETQVTFSLLILYKKYNYSYCLLSNKECWK